MTTTGNDQAPALASTLLELFKKHSAMRCVLEHTNTDELTLEMRVKTRAAKTLATQAKFLLERQLFALALSPQALSVFANHKQISDSKLEEIHDHIRDELAFRLDEVRAEELIASKIAAASVTIPLIASMLASCELLVVELPGC